MRLIDFKPPDLDGGAQQLADHLPQGKAWNSKNVSNSGLRKTLRGLAPAFIAVQAKLFEFASELNINAAENLLDEWGLSVGVPNACQFNFGSIDRERRAIIRRLNRVPVRTVADFEAIALELTDVVVNITPGAEVDPADKFIMYVDIPIASQPHFPYNFPVLFGTAIEGIIRCVFEEIVPANVVLIFRIV